MFRRYFFGLLKALLVPIVVVGIMSATAMIVRNIHHPFLEPIRTPVVFVANLPRELFREFYNGVETRKRLLPKALFNAETDTSFLEDHFYFVKSGKLFHTKNGIQKTHGVSPDNIIYVGEDLSFLYIKKNDQVAKVSIDKSGLKYLTDWSVHVPYAHHEFYVDTNGYYYSPTYFPLNTQNVNKAGLVRPKLAKILSVSGAPPYGRRTMFLGMTVF